MKAHKNKNHFVVHCLGLMQHLIWWKAIHFSWHCPFKHMIILIWVSCPVHTNITVIYNQPSYNHLTPVIGEVGLRAGQVEELLKEELYLSLYTQQGELSLRGRLLTHLALPTDMTGSGGFFNIPEAGYCICNYVCADLSSVYYIIYSILYIHFTRTWKRLRFSQNCSSELTSSKI